MDFSSVRPSRIAGWIAVSAVLIASTAPAFGATTISPARLFETVGRQHGCRAGRLASHNGVLNVELIYRKSVDANGA